MKKTLSGINTFSFGQDLVFEAYIQYKVGLGLECRTIMQLSCIGIHWVCQGNECFERNEGLLQGQGK